MNRNELVEEILSSPSNNGGITRQMIESMNEPQLRHLMQLYSHAKDHNNSQNNALDDGNNSSNHSNSSQFQIQHKSVSFSDSTISGSHRSSYSTNTGTVVQLFSQYKHQPIHASMNRLQYIRTTATTTTTKTNSNTDRSASATATATATAATDVRLPLEYNAIVVKVWNHDSSDFTQGLNVISVEYDNTHHNHNNHSNIRGNATLLMLESTGIKQRSQLKIYQLNYHDRHTTHSNTNNVTNNVTNNNNNSNHNNNNHNGVCDLDPLLFGEGCALFVDDQHGHFHHQQQICIYQLTYKSGRVLVYNLDDFQKLKEIALPSAMKEGWGLFYDITNKEFLATDGTAKIYFLNRRAFTIDRYITVRMCVVNNGEEEEEQQSDGHSGHSSGHSSANNTHNGHNNTNDAHPHQKYGKWMELSDMNDITVIHGWIFANRWKDTRIFVIAPQTGIVYATINCEQLIPKNVIQFTDPKHVRNGVFNGIAFDFVHTHIIVTGKFWSKMYSIELPEFMQ